jgi:hypothetical protein
MTKWLVRGVNWSDAGPLLVFWTVRCYNGIALSDLAVSGILPLNR